MKKFLKIFALCAGCLLFLFFCTGISVSESIVTATVDNFDNVIWDSVKKGGTVELTGEIDDKALGRIRHSLQFFSEKRGKKFNLDLSKVTGLKQLPSESFKNCGCLKSITLPASIESIGDCVFWDCEWLEQIIVDDNNTYYKSVDDVLYSKDGSVLVWYPCKKKDKKFVLPDIVTCIEKDAFQRLWNLVEFAVNANNQNYKAVDGILYTKDGTALIRFPSKKKERSFTVPVGVKIIENNAFQNCQSIKSIIFPTGLKIIGDYAFQWCSGPFSGLDNIMLPNSLKTIGKNAFEHCMYLKSITLPASVENIGNNIFEYCMNLKTVVFLDGITSISDYTFIYCMKLETVTIPDSMKSIGVRVFSGCKNLKSINYSGSIDQWNTISKDSEWNFGCPSLTSKIINFNYQEN